MVDLPVYGTGYPCCTFPSIIFHSAVICLASDKMLIIMVGSQRNKTQDISNDILPLCGNMTEEAFEYRMVS